MTEKLATYTEHLAGAYLGQRQGCFRCGLKIADDRGAMVADGSPLLAGFPEGKQIYIAGGGGRRHMTTYRPDGHEIRVCVP